MGRSNLINHSTPRKKHTVRDRAEWILRLLYAPDRHGRKKRPLFGKTRIMKAAFILHRKLEEHFGLETGFDFRPDKYGPLDPEVYSALTYLENEGLITITESDDHDDTYDLVKYALTEDGGRKAEELYYDIPEEQRELVDWVKGEHAMKKLGELLTYVYDEYPEMTTKSELI